MRPLRLSRIRLAARSPSISENIHSVAPKILPLPFPRCVFQLSERTRLLIFGSCLRLHFLPPILRGEKQTSLGGVGGVGGGGVGVNFAF